MDYIDAEAQIADCDSSEDSQEWGKFDCDLETFLVDTPIVPFGPRPAEYSSEGEGCSTDAPTPTGPLSMGRPGHLISDQPLPPPRKRSLGSSYCNEAYDRSFLYGMGVKRAAGLLY